MNISMLADKEIVTATQEDIPMAKAVAEGIIPILGEGWSLNDEGTRILASLKFKNFKKALAYVNELGVVADSAMHHPDFELGWGYVRLSIQTHSIGGLHDADFVLAAKAQVLYNEQKNN